jgi:hypothetical protein
MRRHTCHQLLDAAGRGGRSRPMGRRCRATQAYTRGVPLYETTAGPWPRTIPCGRALPRRHHPRRSPVAWPACDGHPTPDHLQPRRMRRHTPEGRDDRPRYAPALIPARPAPRGRPCSATSAADGAWLGESGEYCSVALQWHPGDDPRGADHRDDGSQRAEQHASPLSCMHRRPAVWHLDEVTVVRGLAAETAVDEMSSCVGTNTSCGGSSTRWITAVGMCRPPCVVVITMTCV